MGRADYLKLGTWNALCDRCQRKYKADELRLEWTGWQVCKRCYEPRHPQDFLKGHRDDPQVEWTRPDSLDAVVKSITDESYIAAADGLDIINMVSQTAVRIIFLVSENRNIGDVVTIYKSSPTQTLWVMPSAYSGTTTSVSTQRLVDSNANFSASTADLAVVNFTVDPLSNAFYSVESSTRLDLGVLDTFQTVGDVYVTREATPIRSSSIPYVAKYELKATGWEEISYTPTGI